MAQDFENGANMGEAGGCSQECPLFEHIDSLKDALLEIKYLKQFVQEECSRLRNKMGSLESRLNEIIL